MLSDRVRMDAYYHANFENTRHFKGKTVLDVGTGSGILAIWSAQAGARKVYAVEATDMAAHARALVAGNNLEDVVEVIQGYIEDITLPEQGALMLSIKGSGNIHGNPVVGLGSVGVYPGFGYIVIAATSFLFLLGSRRGWATSLCGSPCSTLLCTPETDG
ncbi:hypothetical protein M758_2G168600 [Ceratodon purpureus]|nr:hypothetical protein M758_2G168600 [Ceratodon purpureus]KAG0627025.1 hypothetical protein M758_2G168600 [Ceratodon purpureus]